MTTSHQRFGALGPRDLIVWALFAGVLLVAPLLFSSGLGITMLSQVDRAPSASTMMTC